MNVGAFGENFPYSNFHDLNMDWIIKIAKDFLDQYTHIEELIETGKTDIQNLTESELAQIRETAETLKNLLQQWYDTHSADIATQLADALSQLSSALTNALTNFNTQATQKASEVIETIPADYSEFFAKALKYQLNITGDLNTISTNGWWGVWNPTSVTNKPDGATIGTVVSMQFDQALDGSSRGFGQYWVDAISGKIWYRFLRPTASTPYIGEWIPLTPNIDTRPTLRFNGDIVGDLNSIDSSGWWGVWNASAVTNKPTESAIGIMLCLQYDGTTQANSGFSQFFIEAISGKIWYRFARPHESTPYFTEWESVNTDVLAFKNDFTGDLNTLITMGIYGIWNMNAVTNEPEGAELGTVTVLKFDADDGYIQIYTEAITGRIWTRFIRGTSYVGVWQEVKAGSNYHMACIGDSITSGSYSQADGTAVVASNAEWAYPNRISRMYGCKLANVASPGASVLYFRNQLSGIPSSANIITIMGGINDYITNTQLGTYESTDTTTVCGALNNLIETISTDHPNARLVLLTPINCNVAGTSFSTKYGLNFRFHNFTLEELYTQYKAIADKYEIELIDLLHNSVVNLLNLPNVLKDGIHPTKEFYASLANYIGSKLF